MTTTYTSEVIASRVTEYRTDGEPVETIVRREQWGDRPPRWIVYLNVCNGVGQGIIECNSREQALQTAGIMEDDQ